MYRPSAFALAVVLLATPLYAREMTAQKDGSSSQTRNEFGFGFGFGSFTVPTFSTNPVSSWFSKQKTATTVQPSSSLTGLPWTMTFDQQMHGGLPVDTAWQDKSSTNAPSSAPATSQPSKISAPANAPQATAPQAPAPSTPTSAAVQPTSGSACSATDTSAQAVEDCVNAMRRNPRAWTDHFPASCGWQSWINEVSNPRRPKLNSDDRLASSSRRMAEDMAGTRTVSHVGSDGSTMAQRIAAAGFTSYPQAENVAGGQRSALEVAADWMCSSGHRANLMSCDIDRVGTSTAYDVSGRAYYVQDFGCSQTNSCSC